MLFFGRLLQACTGRYGTAVLAAIVVVQGYWLIRPVAQPLDPGRAEAADRLGEQVADALGDHAGDTWSGRYVKVARLAGDPNDHIRRRIESALQARTNCVVVGDTIATDIRNDAAAKGARLGLIAAPTADALKTPPVGTPDAALDLARRAKTDYTVYGTVEDFRSTRGVPSVRVRVGVADAASGATVFEETFSTGGKMVWADALPAPVAPRRALPLLAGVFFVLLFPVLTSPFWKSMLGIESALVNAACLGFMTLTDALAAWALMGFWLGTVWAVVFLALVSGAACAYNLFFLSMLEESRERMLFEA